MMNAWNIAEKDAFLRFAPKYFDYLKTTDKVKIHAVERPVGRRLKKCYKSFFFGQGEVGEEGTKH